MRIEDDTRVRVFLGKASIMGTFMPWVKIDYWVIPEIPLRVEKWNLQKKPEIPPNNPP